MQSNQPHAKQQMQSKLIRGFVQGTSLRDAPQKHSDLASGVRCAGAPARCLAEVERMQVWLRTNIRQEIIFVRLQIRVRSGL
jgi:hypothetical protein